MGNVTVRVIFGVLCLMLAAPGLAKGQSLELFGSAGPTISDAGHSVAAGAGFSPHRLLTLVFSFDRTHLESRTTTYPGGFSYFRGGTLYLGSAELRVLPFGRARIGPYGLGGFFTGISRPNVNVNFRNPITNFAAGMFIGGGIHIPVNEQFNVFADGRMMVGGEGREGMVAVLPVRAGVSFRF
jgi:hypothetical protein